MAKGKEGGGIPRHSTGKSVHELLERLRKLYPEHPLNVKPAEPFQVLVGTMLSSRTKDPTTNAAMERLWRRGNTAAGLLEIPEGELASLIRPVGFYASKARMLHGLCRLLLSEFDGVVPETREELMALPGVGRKTANLVLNICFDYPAISVDTHVHRISNRLGWVATRVAEKTEEALMQVVPRQYWSQLNRVLVNHGQQICHPVGPRCSACPIADYCMRVGVVKSR